jgi:hypothetical protein
MSHAHLDQFTTRPIQRTLALCALPMASVSNPAAADGPPKQLYGKTVTWSYAIDAVQTRADGAVQNPHVTYQTAVYVSTAGRLFKRGTASSRGGSGTSEVMSGASRSSRGSQIGFVGKTLVSGYVFNSGAVQTRIDFDADYRSCKASVRLGREGGRPIVWNSFDGDPRVVTSASVGSTSCSVQDGNALAGQ